MNIWLFMGGTAVLAWLSRHSLRQPQSHGFYRFIAWECLLLLFLHNRAFWFVDRFAPHQLLSWVLLFSSIAVVLASIHTLRQHGAHDAARNDSSLLTFEKTAALVTQGIYAHVRHPMYASLLLLGWGLYCKHPSWWPGALLALAASGALALTALAEERENVAYFGAPYGDYMKNTKRFLPWVW